MICDREFKLMKLRENLDILSTICPAFWSLTLYASLMLFSLHLLKSRRTLFRAYLISRCLQTLPLSRP